jgi:hypothetical protein
MNQLDCRKTLKYLYSGPRGRPVLVDVPTLNFLMVDGCGKPSGTEFQQAASTLYPVAYTLKFTTLVQSGLDYHVMPMEVAWRVNREEKRFAWTMMIMQPEIICAEQIHQAIEKAQAKQPLPLLDRLRFEPFTEGMCVQCFHVGPYEEMDASAARMAAYAEGQGYTIPVRNAHDIYLNDVRKTKPENLKTIMRFSVRPEPQEK